jgi:molybdopterin molybdotransferase
VRAGAVVLAAGARIGPAELGALVVAGRGEVRCARVPRLAVLATGDELVAPGGPLGPGQVHDANRVAVAAQAREAGAAVALHGPVPDDPESTEAALARAVEDADVLVVTGGVSVGRHDHVKDALDRLGFARAFWGVALKPGKPTWAGARGGQLAFGLPGNPVSAMVTFRLFVLPALLALQGAPPPGTRVARLGEAVRRGPEREQAVRVRLEERADGAVAHPTGPQGSHVLTSMLGADGLALVPAGDGELEAGARVEVEPL